MDLSRDASSSSKLNPVAINPHLILNQDELPSPTPPSPGHLAGPAHSAVVAHKSKVAVIDLEELPTPVTSPAHLVGPMEIDTEASTAGVSSEPKVTVLDKGKSPILTPPPAHLAAQPPRPMQMEAPTAAVSSQSQVILGMEELSLTTPAAAAANLPSFSMVTTLSDTSESESEPEPEYIKPVTVEGIFQDISARRDALIRALTTDQEEFYGLCYPDQPAVFLYGNADGSWEVTRPENYLPADVPDPAAGLNYVRDEMTRFDWLSRVAVRADSWLVSLVPFFGIKLNANQRMHLFDMISDLPTVFETFSQFHDSIWLPTNMPPSPDLMQNNYRPDNSSRAPAENVPLSSDLMENVSNPNNDSSTHAEEDMPPSPGLMQNVYNLNNDSRTHDEENDEELDEVSDQTFCAACGARYHANGFWICCDICDRWLHGKCVKITASEAKHIHRYKCPDCESEEIGE